MGALWLGSLILAVLFRFPLLALLLPSAVTALYLVWREPERKERNFALILFAVGALVGLAIEVVYLRDVFGNRINTLFKFYYQIWVLWALAAAYGVWRVLDAAFAERERATGRSREIEYGASPPVKAAAGPGQRCSACWCCRV